LLKLFTAGKALLMDSATSAGYNHAFHGDNIFKGVASYYSNFFKAATLNITEKKKLAEALGLMHKITLAETHEKLGIGDTVSGGVGKVINMLHASTLMPMQQTFSQQALRMQSSHTLSHWVNQGFDNLEPVVKATLERYGINKADFEILKSHKVKLGETEVINETALFNNPSKESSLTWNKVTKLLNKSEASIGIPGPIENAVFKSNNPNTLHGQIWRTIGMFKTFPMAVMNNLGEIKDFNPTKKVDVVNGFMKHKGNYGNVAQAMAAMMGASYAGIVLNEYLMNDRTPPPPSPELLGRIFIESGVAGLWGDVMATDYSRYGVVNIATGLLGPGASTLMEGVTAIYGLSQGVFDETKEADATNLLKFIMKRKPGNLPALKPIMDQAIWQQLDPEYAMRRQANEMKLMMETGQQPAGLR